MKLTKKQDALLVRASLDDGLLYPSARERASADVLVRAGLLAPWTEGGYRLTPNGWLVAEGATGLATPLDD